MNSFLTEFSYGFALTHELCNSAGVGLQIAPKFPSLFEEGKPGGGYDVMLGSASNPFFIQFKLSEYLYGSNAAEYASGVMPLPYYRFSLHPRAKSKQHQMLIDLESKGYPVVYAAPKFHQTERFNTLFASYKIKESSFVVRPSEIGALPDDEKHKVIFNQYGNAWFCSDPIPVQAVGSVETFLSSLAYTSFERVRKVEWNQVIHDMVSIIQENVSQNFDFIRPPFRDSPRQAAFLASTYFNLHTFEAIPKI